MATSNDIRIYGNGGLAGSTSSVPQREAMNRTRVELDDGRVVLVPTEMLHLRDDGSFFMDMSPAELEPYLAAEDLAADGAAGHRETDPRGAQRLSLASEQLRIGKRIVESGIVRVIKTVHEREEVVDTPLVSESYDVQRVPVNEVVDRASPIREEGDTVIVPIYEEVLVVEKRLVLREELHLTRRIEQTHDSRRVTLRHEEAHVQREAPPQREAG